MNNNITAVPAKRIKNMESFKKITLIVIVCFAGRYCFAQQQKKEIKEVQYRAVHWTVEEGLNKERWHTAMIKDVNGFLWVGSSHGELSRFDGYRFQQYYPDIKKHGAIRSDNCLAFVEDSLHNIWIGRFHGLSRYDIRADTFTNFVSLIDTANSNDAVIPFWASSNDVFCIEAGTWITAYNIYSFARKKLLKISSADKVHLAMPAAAYSIFDSVSNSVWILPEDEEGLVQFSLSTGKITRHTRAEYKSHGSYVHHDAEAMRFDRNRNCIWINSHDGLTQFTMVDQQFCAYGLYSCNG